MAPETDDHIDAVIGRFSACEAIAVTLGRGASPAADEALCEAERSLLTAEASTRGGRYRALCFKTLQASQHFADDEPEIAEMMWRVHFQACAGKPVEHLLAKLVEAVEPGFHLRLLRSAWRDAAALEAKRAAA